MCLPLLLVPFYLFFARTTYIFNLNAALKYFSKRKQELLPLFVSMIQVRNDKKENLSKILFKDIQKYKHSYCP
jgi:hypothetical protein